MTKQTTRYELFCDTCGSFVSSSHSLDKAIQYARDNGDAVDTDYEPAKVMCAFCKLEWSAGAIAR